MMVLGVYEFIYIYIFTILNTILRTAVVTHGNVWLKLVASIFLGV